MDRASMWISNNDVKPNMMTAGGMLDARGGRSPSRPHMKWKNAFGFVYQVRMKLGHRPRLYNQFIDIMRKVHNRSVETRQVVNVITELFKDHPDLIRGFNAFLPQRHQIEPETSRARPDLAGDAPFTRARIVRFTLNVKKRFEDDEKRPDKYERFIEVLYLYKALSQQLRGARKCAKKLREEEVYEEVRKLFENNEDLLREFSEFLPYNKRLSDMYGVGVYSMGDEPYNCSCCSDLNNTSIVDTDLTAPTIDTSLILPDTPPSLSLPILKAEPQEIGELPSLGPSDLDFPDPPSPLMNSLIKSHDMQLVSNLLSNNNLDNTAAVIVKQEVPTDFDHLDDLDEDETGLTDIETGDETQDSGSECGLRNLRKRLRRLSDF